MVVAIDGPSGVGKTTVSRAVAAALGVPHLDTGAYYRMATMLALRAGVDGGTPQAILAAVQGAQVDFRDGELLLDGSSVTEELRSDSVTAAVSRVSALSEVRAAIVEMQRRWVSDHGGNAVVEGRDIGTVVFPHAAVKVYLTADLATRAQRRSGDAEAMTSSLDEVVAAMAERDRADSTRETSPLRPADDAVTIDTTNLSVAEVVHRILDLVGAV